MGVTIPSGGSSGSGMWEGLGGGSGGSSFRGSCGPVSVSDKDFRTHCVERGPCRCGARAEGIGAAARAEGKGAALRAALGSSLMLLAHP